MNCDFDPRVFDEHAEVCKVLANPKRLMILYILSQGEKTVGELATAIGIPMANASQHLAKLRSRGLVTTKKIGQTVIYSISDHRIPQACDLIRATLLERLRQQASIIKSIEEFKPMGQNRIQNNAKPTIKNMEA